MNKTPIREVRLLAIIAMLPLLLLAACGTQQSSAAPFIPLETDWPAIPAGQGILERVAGVEGKMLKYLQAMDNNQGYRTHRVSAADRQLIAAWLDRLPAAHRVILDTRVVAVALVDNFQGSGMTDFLRTAGSSQYPQRFILFINADILTKTMSTRLGERDGSVFRTSNDGEKLQVRASLADGGDAPAIWFLLMHEVSHLYDYVEHVTPKVEASLPDDGDATGKAADRPFTSETWKDISTPVASADYPLRSQLHFYGLQDALLDFDRAPELFDQLLASPFASIYGSQTWAEDWAELSTWHQFTEAGGRLEIQLADQAGVVKKAWLPLENPRVKARFKQLEDQHLGGF